MPSPVSSPGPKDPAKSIWGRHSSPPTSLPSYSVPPVSGMEQAQEPADRYSRSLAFLPEVPTAPLSVLRRTNQNHA